MAEQNISIGGKVFEVACRDGEEQFLIAAAAMLDTEAQTLLAQAGRIPEGRMLLMSGLMLADRTAAAEAALADAQSQIAAMEAELTALRNAPPPQPVRVEVPVIPEGVTDRLAEFAARAEALAEQMEHREA
ncbi:cell division protein ZapA [Rhodobaculum claviforme]|uniref:Cell division protein ZapA n=1 Tax=Rhodobaculum claviforme TaxID=1549854 RepID=A0A934TNG0_9RHOB|nr:cell division protein ZapA [Rhodobaculum claviforme]MBK5928928.1 cell division protein ZapA [Rhodobaculum claviforme]